MWNPHYRYWMVSKNWSQTNTVPYKAQECYVERALSLYTYITGEEMGRKNQGRIQHCEKRILPGLYLWRAADFWILWCCAWWSSWFVSDVPLWWLHFAVLLCKNQVHLENRWKWGECLWSRDVHVSTVSLLMLTGWSNCHWLLWWQVWLPRFQNLTKNFYVT